MTATERDLQILLGYLLNRKLKQKEVIDALGISRATFNHQKHRGGLTSPKNLIAAAHYFDLNPLELLMHYSYITVDQVVDCWERRDTIPHRPTDRRE